MQPTAIMEENFTERETLTLHTVVQPVWAFYCFKTAFIECPVCVDGWMDECTDGWMNG